MRRIAVIALLSGAWVAGAAADEPKPVPPPPPTLPRPPPTPPVPDPSATPGPNHMPPPSEDPVNHPPTPAPPPPPAPVPPAPAATTTVPVPEKPAEKPLSASSFGPMWKEHNVDMGRGRHVMRLTLPANLVAECGNYVWVAAQFYDESGALIRSEIPEFADDEGNIKLVTQTAYVALPRERLTFGFYVPYGAFPRRPEGKYKVEMRLRLVERRSPQNRLLATGTTTFFVEG